MSSTTQAENIGDTVARLSVSYETRLESMLLADNSVRQVGYCLELCGRDGDGPPLSPGDERSKEIYRALREIALQVVPEEDHDCQFELDGSYSSLHYDNNPKSPAKVHLAIYIFHKDGFERPIDSGLAQGLHELECRLQDLGIHNGNGR